MGEDLVKALDTLLDVQDSSGMNRKKDFLIRQKDNQTLQDILYFVFNPYIRTGIGWAKLNKFKDSNARTDDTMEDVMCWTIQGMFSYLLHNNTGQDKDIIKIVTYVETQFRNTRFYDLIYGIFTKSVKLGVSTTTFNKIWPNLIPGFAVQLACKWQDNIDYLTNKQVWVTEKLDGNRCFARVENGNCIFYSRSGREIEGMENVNEELRRLPNGFYDGELLAADFSATQSEIRRKGNVKELVFHIFDYVKLVEVEKQQGDNSYEIRRSFLELVFDNLENFKYVKLLPVIHSGIFDYELIAKLLDEYTDNGSEGLMINTNHPYVFGRTCELLKVKKMNTCDLEIVDIQEGRGEFAGTAGALIVDYKGYRVGVGSGLTEQDRIYYWRNKEDLIGRVIEVKYFEETKDQNGNLSLRFPVYMGLRDVDKEVSYE